MSLFPSVIIVFLIMLIQVFLQLGPGIFAIFYHNSLGKVSSKKADDRALSFIIGTELCASAAILIVYLTTAFFVARVNGNHSIFIYIMAGICIVEAIFTFFNYYKLGKKYKNTTRLFLPGHLSKNLIAHSEHAKNRSDTIVLGIVSYALELIFALPLLVILSYMILKISPDFSYLYIIIYIIVSTLPLFLVRIFYRTGHNLVSIEKFRLKLKPFVRIIIPGSFLIISLILILTEIFK